MNRVLTLITTGLFLTGLAMVPLSARADQAVVNGKTIVTTHTDPLPAPKVAPNGKIGGKTTVTPGGSATGAATVKTQAEGAS